jgi:methylenetetrahydrofolate reductase (NADPH)
VGIKIPVIAGIMPIISYKQIERMTSLANITIPNDLAKQVEKFKDNPLDIKKLGIDFGIEQCKNLVMNGFKNLHFYTLNQYNATSKIIKYI